MLNNLVPSLYGQEAFWPELGVRRRHVSAGDDAYEIVQEVPI